MNKFSISKYSILIVLPLVLLAGSCNLTPTNEVSPAAVEETQKQVFSYEGVEGIDAMSLLKEKYEVQIQDFGPGLGEFVETIGGIAPGADEFWAFKVNGETANVGASQYVTKTGDVIEWELEKIGEY